MLVAGVELQAGVVVCLGEVVEQLKASWVVEVVALAVPHWVLQGQMEEAGARSFETGVQEVEGRLVGRVVQAAQEAARRE